MEEIYLFDKKLFDNIKVVQQNYVIGVDIYDNNVLSYCLARNIDGVIEFILCKSMKDKKEFEKEVENLAKYFDAVIIRENE